MAALLLLGGLVPGAPAIAREEAGGPPDGAGGRAGDEMVWGPDVRMTRDASGDGFPSLFFDPAGDVHLFWERYKDRRMHLRAQDNGSVLDPETLVLAANPPALHSGQRTPNIALDADLRVHALWATQGIFGPMYQPFGPDGWNLSAPINLAPLAQRPHAASLAVGPGGTAYVAYENENDDRVEMAYVENGSDGYRLHTGYIAGWWGTGPVIGVDPNGYVHVIFSNMSSPLLCHSVFSAVGSILYAATTLLDYGQVMQEWAAPRLAFGPDGTMHLLQASTVNGTRSLYYIKMDWKGTRYTGYLCITNDSADFGDMRVDKDRNVHIVYGGANDGQIYYVRIQPGKENDTLSPVRLTNDSGASRDPAIAAGPNGALAVAWTDGRDGNAEVYFKAGFRPGLRLAWPGTWQWHAFHLNETRRLPVTLQNLGAACETVRLELNVDFRGAMGGVGKDYAGTGWKAWLDENQTVLGPRESRDLRVNVRGPVSGEDGQDIELDLTAVSVRDGSVRDDLAQVAWLRLERRVELGCSGDFSETPPGEPAAYNLTVRTWDYYDTLTLSATEPPGWLAAVNVSRLELGPWETRNLSLSVTPDADAPANETANISVVARSETSPEINDRVNVHVRVARILEVSMAAEQAEKSVRPAETAEYRIHLEKRGNVAGVTEATVETGTVPAGWNATLGPATLSLYLDRPLMVVLRLQAPAEALFGECATVRVLARDEGGGLLADCAVNATVEAVRKVHMQTMNFSLEAFPGERTGTPVVVVNEGNCEEVLAQGERIMPSGWEARFELPGGGVVGPGSPAVLAPRSVTELFFAVYVAADSTVDTYFVTARLQTGNGTDLESMVYVYVLRKVALAVRADRTEAVVRPGETAAFVFAARNDGNLAEAVSFNLSGAPAGWAAPEFLADNERLTRRLDVAPFGSARMFLNVAVPPNTTLAGVELSVNASSLNGYAVSFGLRIRILGVNLALSNLTYAPQKPRPGQAVHFRLEVANTGDVDIGSVVLAVRDGGRTLHVRDLGRLEPGMGWVFEFEWTAAAGTHTLVFSADPNGTVAERNEGDNKVQVTVLVETGKAGMPPAAQIAAAAVSGAVLVGAALALWRRRARRAGPGK